MSEFTELPDLAVRSLGGSVVSANDELFAERESLIRASAPVYQPHTFGPKGQIYDGWETRRRRAPGHDWAVIRLGVPGIIRGVVVDTAFFVGNYPEYASIEAAAVPGYPSPEELTGAEWVEIVPKSALAGDARMPFAVDSQRRFTHVRLNIYPDGGVARLRVHGMAVPDPERFDGVSLDLAAMENGGLVTGCSNGFFGVPGNLLLPGLPRNMGDGWESARRREPGNEWVEIRLAAQGLVRQVEIDTTHFVGNAPGWFALTGEGSVEIVAKTRLQPDTRHLFRVRQPGAVRQVRLDIYPDGGVGRLRLFGSLTENGRHEVTHSYVEATR